MSNVTISGRTVDLEKERSAAHALVDQEAEKRRLVYITAGSGQALTYQRKVEEATKFFDTQEPQEADFPMLTATVGIDGENLEEVAQVILDRSNQFAIIGAALERTRALVHQNIDAAETLLDIQKATIIEWPY